METANHKPITRTPAMQPAASRLVQAKALGMDPSVSALASLPVSSPNDTAEKEAQATAERIVGTANPESSPASPRAVQLQRSFQSPYLMRFAGSGIFAQKTGRGALRVSRKEEGPGTVGSNVAAGIHNGMAEGSPLPLGVRQFMEPRFGADFSGVRIHTGDKAAGLNRQLSAQAFAVGNDIFFGKDKFQPGSREGKELIAHELTHTLQQGEGLRRRTLEVAGKTMYVASDGKLVELPPDMTDAEATRLEAQAKAAEKKLGKGPAPKPVPDVKKLAKTAGKKEKPKPAAKGKKRFGGINKAAPKAGAGMPILKVGPGKVAQYLAAKAMPALAKGVAVLRKLKQNEQTHDDAAEKLKQSQKAVVIPPSEGQATSNTGQVAAVSSYPPPVVDEKRGKQQLQASLEENFPRSIEEVDNFKRDQKAQHMGADVMKVVQSDKNAVSATFGEMEQTPPPAPPEHAPEALPPEEVAPPTASLDLGQGAVPSLQKEHTDVSGYTKEADNKLKEEGVSQEQLDMVDSGDLAEANKEKKGMQKAAQVEPLAIQKFAQGAAGTVQRDLKQEEKKGRDDLKAKRKTGLGATAKKQTEAKKALEKKREEVASKINGIFQAAQDKVKKKLADLEKESMKRFEEGNAKATRQFEDNVNRELAAYKEDRYSGWFGWARKAKDWLLGMDELPAVKAIFERNRSVFVNTINKLVEDITADSKRVIQECKDELANAKKAIKEYVDKLGPDLRDIGNKTAEEMNDKLQELDQFVNKKEEELREKLKDKQTAAIKAIDEKIEKMKEAMAGALSKLGKLLLLAAKKFFTWALEKVGVSLSTIEGIINKGAAVLKAIFTQPIQFVKNLMNAAITGFKNFGKNFLTHLKNALFEWLTGSLEGLVLPKTWNFQGIIGIALQMIGISYQNIRKHMVTVMTEPVVAGLEKTFTLVKTLITEGPMAAWEQLKEMAGEMRDAFIEAVKDFIKTKIIEQAIQWLVSLFIPGAGIIKAVIGIYDTIVFFIQKAKQIMQMISNFLGSIAEIAAGNIGAAASAMESGLARGLSLVISFLAQLLHLSGITDKIKNALQKIRAKVDDVLLKVAKWIGEKAKKLWGKLIGKTTTKPEEIVSATDEDTDKQLAAVSEPFSMSGAGHRVWLEKKNGKWEMMMGSEVPGILFTKLLSAEIEVKANREAKVPPKVKGSTWDVLLEAIDKRKGDAILIHELLNRIERKDPDRKSLQALVPKEINKLISKLTTLGDNHGIKSLMTISTMKHQSRFVAGDTINLAHEKLGDLQKVRSVFYGGFNSTATNWRDNRLAAIFSPATPLGGLEDPAQKSNFISEAVHSEERWYSKTSIGPAIYATVPKGDVSIDHHPEGVAQHWNTKGRYTDQATREIWYSNITINNLRLISGKLNSSLGSKEPTKELQVGPKFTGPMKAGYELP